MTTVKENIKRINDERAAFWEAKGKPLADIAATRNFTPVETRAWDDAEKTFEAYSERIKTLEKSAEQDRGLEAYAGSIDTATRSNASDTEWRNLATGDRAGLRAGESIRENSEYQRAAAKTAEADERTLAHYGSLGAQIRALATTGTGSAIVPTVWAANVIDLVRAESQVVNAGATVVPMETKQLVIGRQTGDPTAAFRAESTTIVPSDPTFDSVTLTAKTVSALVTGSIEFFQDAPNAESLISQSLAKRMAQQIDLVCLYGGTIAGAGAINLPSDPNPRGVLAAMLANRPTNVLGTGAANGTTQSASAFWGEVIDALYTVKDSNEDPTGMLWSTKLARLYDRATDTTGQSLAVPPALESIKRLTTNQIPSYTVGTNATATDLFVADWRQLLIGQRMEITLQPLRELYQGTGQIGVLATARVDVQIARNSAFAIYRGLKGAA